MTRQELIKVPDGNRELEIDYVAILHSRSMGWTMGDWSREHKTYLTGPSALKGWDEIAEDVLEEHRDAWTELASR